MGVIEEANALSLEEFEARYLSSFPNFNHFTFIQQGSQIQTDITLVTAKSMNATDFEACFALIESTSANVYRQSSVGWSPKSKRSEMKLLDMKYLLVKPRSTCPRRPRSPARARKPESPGDSDIIGFLSFMPTYEDDRCLLYCYEIHFSESAQSSGLGTHLMHLYEHIAKAIRVEKTMLTVF